MPRKKYGEIDGCILPAIGNNHIEMNMDGRGNLGREKKAQGVFQRVEKESERRTERRNGRRRMKKSGKSK